jgi:uncharacterized membrane protein YcaP (DUF421 family)
MRPGGQLRIELFDPLGGAAPLARGVALAVIAVLWTILLVRLVGLRSFSKMTSFDFVTTIATGSLIAQAATRSEWPAFLQCLAAIAGVFAVQFALARMRQDSAALSRLVKNDPVLLMEGGRFIDTALVATRVSRANILEKLRVADPKTIGNVYAVVLETTGDISVLTGDSDPRLLEGVVRL